MKHRTELVVTAICLVLLGARKSSAQLGLVNPGTRSNSLAGSVTASVDDASAFWYNPAAIQAAGEQVRLADNEYELQLDWQTLYTHTGDLSTLSLVPTLFSFVPAAISTDRVVWGFGATQPFYRNVGLRPFGSNAEMTQAVFDLALGVGIGIGDVKEQKLEGGRVRRSYPFRIGMTADFILSSILLEDAATIGISEEHRAAAGFTGAIGATYEHSFDAPASDEHGLRSAFWIRSVNVGVRYRHKAGLDFTGSGFGAVNGAIGMAAIDFPATFSMGGGLDFVIGEADILSVTGTYDAIFYADAGTSSALGTYRDISSYAFGIEYQPSSWGPVSGLRGGYRYSEDGGPGIAQSNSIHLGIGFLIDQAHNTELNLSYQLMLINDTQDPTFAFDSSTLNLFGLGFTIRF